MKSRPSISIAMATYNGGRHVGEQLESFAGQTVLPCELVVTDDASTDATADIVTAFAVSAPFPVRLIKNTEQLGYRANFMKAAELCRADLIAFSDQDDVWLPRKLEAVNATFENSDTLLTYHDATVVTENLEPFAFLHEAFGVPAALNPAGSLGAWYFGLGFTLTFRRTLLTFSDLRRRSTDFFSPDQTEAHDQWIPFLASCLGTIGYVAEPLVLYRQHEKNASGWRKEERGIRARWKSFLATDVRLFELREISAKNREAILKEIEMALEGSDPRKARARAAASDYAKIEEIFRLRREIYNANTAFHKLHALVDCVRIGGYRRQRNWGAGRKAFVRDLIRGIGIPDG
jgi:glycosyltransferase involved in cell wall biosynthesis